MISLERAQIHKFDAPENDFLTNMCCELLIRGLFQCKRLEKCMYSLKDPYPNDSFVNNECLIGNYFDLTKGACHLMR